MKLMIISGSRADYNMLENLANELNIQKFEIECIQIGIENYKGPLTRMFGDSLWETSRHIRTTMPDYIIILGDRWEILGAAIAAKMFGVGIIHLGGGETTLGSYDNYFRNMISIVSDYHFVVSKKAKEKLNNMGIKKNVYIVGSPRMDYRHGIVEIITKTTLFKKHNLDPEKKTALVIYHPETINYDIKQVEILVSALKQTDLQYFIISSGQDKNCLIINEKLKEIAEVHETIEHDEWVSFLYSADILIGNSSAGIMEAPYYGLPVINIGDRQKGRERIDEKNVIDCKHDVYEIKEKIYKAVEMKKQINIGIPKLSSCEKIKNILREVL